MPLGDWRWLALAGLCVLVIIAINWREIKISFRKWRSRKKEDDLPEAVDYIDACAIIDRYIHPALRDKRANTALAIRQDIITRFDQVTGAKLGEYEYNRVLLHQWIESNAARLLVENRSKMT